MINSSVFLNECKENGYTLFTGTPCSYLKPFINYVIDDIDLEFVETTNEGGAVALACGAWLGGRKSIVMFQNSGLGNAVNPLTSLSYTMKISFIGIVTLRGEPNGASDEPQHELMGEITTELLDLMKIPWAFFPTEAEEVKEAFSRADKICEEQGRAFFFVMKKGSVDSYELKSTHVDRLIDPHRTQINRLLNREGMITRTEAIKSLKGKLSKEDMFIATTGKTGRELFEIEDSPNNLYMVGSMGCAVAIALGLSRTEFKEKIVVIDGDGAILMKLGNMALAGQMGPINLIHILLDNGVHDSTGGQRTFSESIDFCGIARSCGYEIIYEVDSIESFEVALENILENGGLSFVRFVIKAGSPKDLGRPTVTPEQVAMRMKEYIREINERSN